MKMSRVESAIRAVIEYNKAFNLHNVAAMMQCLSDDCVLEGHSPAPDGKVYSGKESIAQYWTEFFRASPEAHIEVEQIFGFGIRCVMRWKCEWMDLEGKKAHMRGMDSFQLRNELIIGQMSYVKK